MSQILTDGLQKLSEYDFSSLSFTTVSHEGCGGGLGDN